MAERLASAREAGQVLRFVASLGADGQAEVSLKSLPDDHPFAHTRPDRQCGRIHY